MQREESIKLFNYLIKNGIAIGSRAWGGFTKESDFDLVFSVEKYDSILAEIFKNKIDIRIDPVGGSSGHHEDNTMFNIFNDKLYFHDGLVINVLTYKEEDIPKIVELNKIIYGFRDTTIYEKMAKNKTMRINIVEALLNALFQPEEREIETPTDFHDDDFPF